MTPLVVSSIPELLAAIRARRDDLEITNQTIDDIAGLADRHASKLLAPEPVKGFGEMSLASVLGALALEVAVVILLEDPEQVARVSRRWTKRKRPQRKHSPPPQLGALLAEGSDDTLIATMEIEHET